MKLPSSLAKLLENKYVLYIVFFLAVANLFGYMVMGNYKAIALFVLVGYLVYNFNKNMTIVLLIPLILASLFTSGFIKEGLENASDDSKIKDDSKEMDASGNPIHSTIDASGNGVKVASSGEAVVAVADKSNNDVPKANEKFSNPYDKRGSRLDYAATVEDAYGDLNKILGGDGIKNLTADTQKLMNQQLQLAEAMKSMTPLLEQAKGLIGGFDMKNFGNITEMAKQFQASG
jgi:hypothetical protein